jgi:hypothetical protein
VIEDNRQLVANTLSAFIDKEMLMRIGLSAKENDQPVNEERNSVDILSNNEIVTTENELNSYNYSIQRLAFLVDSEELFNNLKYVRYLDYKTTFVVYYKNSKLFSLTELDDNRMRFFFPILNKEIITKNLSEIDEFLLSSYKKLVNRLPLKSGEEKVEGKIEGETVFATIDSINESNQT